MESVLVTAAGSTTALSVVKALVHQSSIDVRVVGIDIHQRHEIAGSTACDAFYTVPLSTSQAYVPTLLEICRREHVSMIFPIADPEIEVLAAHTLGFEAQGTHVWAAAEKSVRICNDKLETYRFLRDHDVPTPATWVPGEVPAGVAFPLVVKPANGVSSRDVHVVHDAAGLEVAVAATPNAIVQEHLPGREFTVDVVADQAGQPLAAVPRERLEVKAGICTKGRTVRDERLVELATEVVELLHLSGACNVQLRMDADGLPSVLEINPRFSASLPLTVAAGVNSPLLLVKLATGRPIDVAELAWVEDVHMTRYWEECFYREP